MTRLDRLRPARRRGTATLRSCTCIKVCKGMYLFSFTDIAVGAVCAGRWGRWGSLGPLGAVAVNNVTECRTALRANTLGFRIVNNWNSLPREIVTASSVNALKGKLDREYEKVKYGMNGDWTQLWREK